METPAFFRVRRVTRIDSTNAALRRLAEGGESEGAVLIADTQSGGRGRMGRSFYSPAGTGLYMSVLLRPALEAADTALITTAAAVALHRAILAFAGIMTDIKWVNDLLLNGKKISGILAEGVAGQSVVLGVGVNLCDPPGGFPPEICEVAGSLYGAAQVTETETETQKSGLAARFLTEFYALYTRLPDKAFLAEYRQHCVTLHRRVRVPADPYYEGTAVDIDDSGALLIRLDTGEVRRVDSGEVSMLREKPAAD